MNFVSDLVKEVIRDVNGQEIYYYPINELKTKKHEVYDESIHKVFDNPIALPALISATSQQETAVTHFGVDTKYKIEVFVQYRDLLDKGIKLAMGDYFSFSSVFYEVTDITDIAKMWGQAEHNRGLKIIGTKARESDFKAKFFGPTDLQYTDADAVKKKFEQSRGTEEGDKRELQQHNVLEKPLTGPQEVSSQGVGADGSTHGDSSFYGDK